MAEEQLVGGIANAGQVTRDGPFVLRPSTPYTESIHTFLHALRAAGFEGSSEPVGVDPDGRERLIFIEGDIPLTPYPTWSQTDQALASIARLMRAFHDASATFDPSPFTWNDGLADPAGGSIVCHNDVEPSNIVFRDGMAVGLIDFEFAAPGRPEYDLAQMARVCMPIDDEFDRARLGYAEADWPNRLRLIADAYGLDEAGRREFLSAIEDAMTRIEQAAKDSVRAGNPGAIEMWNKTGGEKRFERRRKWWNDRLDQFEVALW